MNPNQSNPSNPNSAELSQKVCPVCHARWFNGQLMWANGKPGRNIDLAGLVCNTLKKSKQKDCINPCQGQVGGDTWEDRRKFLDQIEAKQKPHHSQGFI